MDAEMFARETEQSRFEPVMFNTFEVFNNAGISTNGEVALDEYLDSLMAEKVDIRYIPLSDGFIVVGTRTDYIKKES